MFFMNIFFPMVKNELLIKYVVPDFTKPNKVLLCEFMQIKIFYPEK